MKRVTFRLKRVEYLLQEQTVLVPDDLGDGELSDLADELYSDAIFTSDDCYDAEPGDHSWREELKFKPTLIYKPDEGLSTYHPELEAAA